ncbi:ribosomal protein S18-alanine N-acetyltransferase [candidate division KSB1 bacterium]|nr:ribosomal protein S18-alanine N-acetyltransferase [candidate division KSB1 bacterium]
MSEYEFKLNDGKKLILRPLRSEDLDQVCEMERLIFESPWTRLSFEKEIDSCFSHSFVVIDVKIIAYIITWIIRDELHIANVAVHPSYRRYGIATRMLNFVTERARQSNCRLVLLEVRKSNRQAIRLYKQLGFKIDGVRKGYYEQQNEDALLMSYVMNQ